MAIYTKQTWANESGGGTPINATRLGYIESGIEAASAGAVYVNVKAYGATGDGTTDDSAAIKAAVAAAIGSYSAGVNQRPTGVLYFPPGDYRVVDQDTLWPGTDPTTGDWLKMRGWTVMGAGKHASTITFDPVLAAEPANLYDGNLMSVLSGDPDSHPSAVGGATWQEVKFQGLSFVSNNQYARCIYIYCWDGRPISDITFEDCDWQGTWQRAIGCDGPTSTPDADQCSEIKFIRCGTRDSTAFTDAFLRLGLTDDADLDQQVNYYFAECSMEYAYGPVVKATRGGVIRVIGGSWILGIDSTTPSAIFEVGGSNTSYGNNATRQLMVWGARFELRHADAHILESRWSSDHSHIVFDGITQADDGGHGDADWPAFVIHSGTYGVGYVKWRDSTLFGHISVKDTDGSYANNGGKLIFDTCGFKNNPLGESGPTQGTAVGSATADAGTDVWTLASHGLSNGDCVVLSSFGGGLAGPTAGEPYHVKSATTDTFKLQSSYGSEFAPTIDVTTGGSATVTQHFLIRRDGNVDPAVVRRDCYRAADT